ncbi:MAG: hypothetical protein A3C12_01115 [Candidatus Sungbacteria bacterium RIFCSPHIGHO2_02_FULL_49_20]|uniref:Conjugal transfer protein TrbC n=1 Tax=Candidatus Sungbacteria bacterium RIFCSPHIGHO2_02_FULL_49_20 TaxID=1802272 RepID=A0A1G2KU72_9BACT|nr:MAG: hypothetical protein A3C12_01115 [Candidatus Sungbacteria bacterium RIFCSPHIGHO2_02_FULL_49_20]
MKVFFYRLLAISWLAAPMSVLAQGSGGKIPPYKAVTGLDTSDTLFAKIGNTAGMIVMGLSVIMIMYAAFLFLTAGGVPDNLTKARNTLIFALAGVAVALLAFVLPTLVSTIFAS